VIQNRLPFVALASLALLVLLPDAAQACPVCFDSREENRQAFLATTAFLSLFPLGLVAGAGLWIRRRFQALDESERAPEGWDDE